MSKKNETKIEEVVQDFSAFMSGTTSQNIRGDSLAMDEPVEVRINSLKVVELTDTSGNTVQGLVADVESDAGDTLWLSGVYGFQNGWLKLLEAANGEIESIAGQTFTLTKTTEATAPAGYVFNWGVV